MLPSGFKNWVSVEEIEEFGPELDGLALLKPRGLLDGEVKVLDSSTTADRPFRGPKRAEGCAGKRVLDQKHIGPRCKDCRYLGRFHSRRIIVARVAGAEPRDLIRLAGSSKSKLFISS